MKYIALKGFSIKGKGVKAGGKPIDVAADKVSGLIAMGRIREATEADMKSKPKTKKGAAATNRAVGIEGGLPEATVPEE